ncbi:hypothetical protein C8Q80DRAFT_1125389 [Daedaleopsis nitida]|nr:hypothetical protein C8Q80DRAFT_1125389 [Daedaleopsis nitida]
MPFRSIVLVLLSALAFGPLVTAAESLAIHVYDAPANCDTVEVSWSGGIANYTLSVASSDSDLPISTYPDISNGTVQWLVVIPAGERVNLTVQDSTGADSSVDLVGAASSSTNSSCLDGAPVSNRLLSHHTGTSYHPTSSSGSNKPLTPVETALVVVLVVILVLIVAIILYRRLHRGEADDNERLSRTVDADEQVATPLIAERAPGFLVAPWDRATSGEAMGVERGGAKLDADSRNPSDAPPPYAPPPPPRQPV